jgi:hypothetical protein
MVDPDTVDVHSGVDPFTTCSWNVGRLRTAVAPGVGFEQSHSALRDALPAPRSMPASGGLRAYKQGPLTCPLATFAVAICNGSFTSTPVIRAHLADPASLPAGEPFRLKQASLGYIHSRENRRGRRNRPRGSRRRSSDVCADEQNRYDGARRSIPLKGPKRP